MIALVISPLAIGILDMLYDSYFICLALLLRGNDFSVFPYFHGAASW
jgi:hypothetical protein